MANIILIHMPFTKAGHMSNSQLSGVRNRALPQVLIDGKENTNK